MNHFLEACRCVEASLVIQQRMNEPVVLEAESLVVIREVEGVELGPFPHSLYTGRLEAALRG